ncbi:MAG: 3'-5' exonuclease [Desulfarculaceae bacterium]|nr:3'-5' exonuclease [Desulfarculaceae bacterium]MCF8071610.1 3'-5' exonuclease [Desulfarculaceae bacterium]MCF8103193.1 3'-5' exonuclease [Desulfarculaceae bacterium]MCF8114889.1 3'-5' exonuclease [Desulfarculaceae bacterium]
MNLWQARLVNQAIRLRLARRKLAPEARGNLMALEGKDGKAPAMDQRYVVVDLETTGLDHTKDRVVSVGAFRVVGGRIRLGEVFSELANPGRGIPVESIKVHGITPDNIRNARPAWEVFREFLLYLGGDIVVAHHARFDLFFLNRVMRAQYGMRMQNLVVDTVLMCRAIHIEPDPYGQKKGAKRCSLDVLAARYGLEVPERHTALGDALATAMILQRLLPDMAAGGWKTLADLISVAGVL